MSNQVVISQVLVLFLVMLGGVYTKKRGIGGKNIHRALSDLLLRVTMPCLILVSFQFDFSREMALTALVMLGVSLGIHGVSALAGCYLYMRYPTSIQQVLRFITVFSNCGFMGFPILESLYGSIGIFYGSIYVISFNVFVWTYGIMVFNQKDGRVKLRKVMLNPGILAIIGGVLLFVFSLQLPPPLFAALDMVGSMTTPIAMLIVGLLLAEVEPRSLFAGLPMYYGSLVRLLAVPLLTLIVLRSAGFEDMIVTICVILAAMPAAANTTIFAQTYCGDAVYASRCVAVSTLLSLLTIPLIVFLI